jgi:uncharacterized membrane protein YebE (DUF533 family)
MARASQDSIDLRSAGVILRLLNLIAMADGTLSLSEENLLDSLIKQYRLQAKVVSWEDDLADPGNIEQLANLIPEPLRPLTLRLAVMVASVCRPNHEEHAICVAERELLCQLAKGLDLNPGQQEQIEHEAAEALKKQASLWEVLYGCFSQRFDFPILS